MYCTWQRVLLPLSPSLSVLITSLILLDSHHIPSTSILDPYEKKICVGWFDLRKDLLDLVTLATASDIYFYFYKVLIFIIYVVWIYLFNFHPLLQHSPTPLGSSSAISLMSSDVKSLKSESYVHTH